MRVWDCFRMPEPVVAEVPGSSSLLLVNLADPTGPADLPDEDEPPQDYKDASAVPSHLPNIKMQGVEKITFLPSATQQEEEEPAPKTPKTPVHLGSADHIVPNACRCVSSKRRTTTKPLNAWRVANTRRPTLLRIILLRWNLRGTGRIRCLKFRTLLSKTAKW